MTLIRLLPSREVLDHLSTEEQSWLIARDYGICNGWRLNFAIDASGASYGADGNSDEISSELDRLLLGKLRSQADVIVTSGKTARVEKYRSSKHAPIAIFTRTGDLDAVPAIQGTQFFRPLVLTPLANVRAVENALSDVDVQVLAFEDNSTTKAWATSIAKVIRGSGFQSPILESGLSSLRTFVANQVVDEICLTIKDSNSVGVSARVLTEAKVADLFGATADFKMANLFTDGQSTFSRWVRNGVAASKPSL